ncbi:hypothetical protein LBMAG48_30680 [Phycisphaerae bacterium]|nr:hypothetical protein LBMAG48_30680 [Phycisphaerae bacterium]
MTPTDYARKFTEFSKIGRNFVPRAKCSIADWQKANSTIGRLIPLAWIEFVQEFGHGRISLESPRGSSFHDGSPTAQACYVQYDDGGYPMDRFYPETYGAEGCCCTLIDYYYNDEAKSVTHPQGIGSREDWIEIGSSWSGDSLHIRSQVPSSEPESSRPAEGEVAWCDHEIGLFTYRWPTVQQFLQCLDEMNQHAKRQPTHEEEEAAREIELRELLRAKGANMPTLHAVKSPAGAVKCPHCNWTFFPREKKAWNGERHVRCAGPLIID